MFMVSKKKRFSKPYSNDPTLWGKNSHTHIWKKKKESRKIYTVKKHPQNSGISGDFEVYLFTWPNISTMTQTL